MYQKRLMQFEIYLQRFSAQHPNAPYITVQGTPMLHALLCTPQRVHTSTPMLHALQAAPQRSMHTVQVEKRPMKETWYASTETYEIWNMYIHHACIYIKRDMKSSTWNISQNRAMKIYVKRPALQNRQRALHYNGSTIAVLMQVCFLGKSPVIERDIWYTSMNICISFIYMSMKYVLHVYTYIHYIYSLNTSMNICISFCLKLTDRYSKRRIYVSKKYVWKRKYVYIKRDVARGINARIDCWTKHTVQSVKLTPGDDNDGTVVLTKSQRSLSNLAVSLSISPSCSLSHLARSLFLSLHLSLSLERALSLALSFSLLLSVIHTQTCWVRSY